jgi:glycine cleavage system regulatory protein
MSFSLFHSIAQSPHFMGGRVAGQAMFDGSDQEYERVASDWQRAHAADAALLNIPSSFQLPLSAHLSAFAEKFDSGPDGQAVAQQLLILF